MCPAAPAAAPGGAGERWSERADGATLLRSPLLRWTVLTLPPAG
jgi:hypothetical protein